MELTPAGCVATFEISIEAMQKAMRKLKSSYLPGLVYSEKKKKCCQPFQSFIENLHLPYTLERIIYVPGA